MKRFIAWTVALNCVLLSPALAQASPSPNPGGKGPSASLKSVSIQYEGSISLGQALGDISAQTGIRFMVSENMARQTIYAHVRADDWKSAVKQLLRDFSIAQMWTDDLRNSKIWILEAADAASRNSRPSELARIASPAPPQPAPANASANIPAVQPAIQLASIPASPVNEEARNSPLAALPPHLRHDPEVLRFLYANGVDLPREVKERYGARMENLPPPRPMFQHVRRNPMFAQFLQANNIRPPGD